MKKDQLKIIGIEKVYEGIPLLKGITFEVNNGEVLCLLGKSGSGKSTLLRIIAGIENAEHGSVYWNDQKIDTTPTHLRRFGLMFQDYALFPHLNVAENVAFGVQMQKLPKVEIIQKVSDALKQVDLLGFEKRHVSELSGGEQQRVALARALAPSPRLLMLDEPLAALDRSLRTQLQGDLRELLHKTNIPAIYVTHDQEEALALGDRLALLNEGEIVQIGEPEEVYRHPRNRWAAQFLGMENLLDGVVENKDPLVLKTTLGRINAAASADAHFAIGDPVSVILRGLEQVPETKSNYENTFMLSVDDCNFRGDHFQITAHNDKQIPLTIKSRARSNRGDVLFVRYTPDNVICLKP